MTLEGPEGAGKSTVAPFLADRLREGGHSVVLTREPGSGAFGNEVRKLLLAGDDLDPWAELFLFLADRANHVRTLVRPSQGQGKIVLCDRFADSTVVYQGHARGLPVETLRELNLLATGRLVPDLTLLFDLPPEQGLARLEAKDRLDREPLAFHERVREGFLAEARREPGRWVVLDASLPLAAVRESAWSALTSRLGQVPTSC
ncbi:MAG: dTMP kinase [Fimbriimonadaceae bacterium]